ncbi:alpha/beta hydrolase [Natronobacterium gregoryi]|uniref:Alpha/beta hydrolase n=2 Tax=Natronobacterium gregoryi TaxID=44930 RepID=L0ALB7_NATGS|nr:dienelactone hydrolase family protein [Natronobacterium gregoryi]AFZ73845.1 putative hydrolase of the alpha/beta superfamily [Natronobacterium gregoryi SP2]ELY65091.1 hydrolase of the alpha/beta superfamily-like protein [Natronobacterium gregoryi SP2]PLK19699.1 alpha/beta hydrolase [Natronobacterium gregoryi SP2]SFJ42378.1 hypothetical protein SAMN05443661_12834 [Natronobacterium gregoryi]
MSDVLVPGGRDVRATLEEPDEETDAIVVACPPHPQHGGSRTDGRLVAMSEALTDRSIACLRFDYGQWDDGYGELADVRNAVCWADGRYDRVGLFGYSFGATLALIATDDLETVDAVSALAPTAHLGADLDALEALESLSVPIQVLYGERDGTVDWEPVVDLATDRDDEVVSIPGDHFFVGQNETIAEHVSAFAASRLFESGRE